MSRWLSISMIALLAGIAAPAEESSLSALDTVLVPGAGGARVCALGDGKGETQVDFGADKEDHHVDFAVGDKDNDQVDFAVAGDKGQDQVDFAIAGERGDEIDFLVDFGADGWLRVDGAAPVPYDREAAYEVRIECAPAGDAWQLHARVVHHDTGALVCAAWTTSDRAPGGFAARARTLLSFEVE